uniref:Uncharacterized protein n=1 Tax=Setaria italica TaxID=4555 RepID=K3Z234_SETIT
MPQYIRERETKSKTKRRASSFTWNGMEQHEMGEIFSFPLSSTF